MDTKLLDKLLRAGFTEKDARRAAGSVTSSPLKSYMPKKMVGKRNYNDIKDLISETSSMADDLEVEEQFNALAQDSDDLKDLQDYSKYTEEVGDVDYNPRVNGSDVPASQNRSMVKNASSEADRYIHKPSVESPLRKFMPDSKTGGKIFDATGSIITRRPIRTALGAIGGAGLVALEEGLTAEEANVNTDLVPGHPKIPFQRDNESRTVPSEGQTERPFDRLLATTGELDANLEPENRANNLNKDSIADFKGSDAKGAAWFGGLQQGTNDQNKLEREGSEIANASLIGNREATAESGRDVAGMMDSIAWNQAADDNIDGIKNTPGQGEVLDVADPAGDMATLRMFNEAREEDIPEEIIDPDGSGDGSGNGLAKKEDINKRNLEGRSLASERLKQAQDANADNAYSMAMLAAGNKIGSSIAGVKNDRSGVDQLTKGGTDHVKNYLQTEAKRKDQEKEEKQLKKDNMLQDPNSTIGKLFAKYGLNSEEATLAGITASQLLAMKSKEDIAAMNSRLKTIQDSKKVKDKLNERQFKYIQKVNKDMNKHYTNYLDTSTGARRTKDILNEIKSGKEPGPRDVELLFKFIKSFDPESVVRESEIKLAESAVSLMGRIKLFSANKFQGALLNKGFRESVLSAAEAMASAQSSIFKKQKAAGFNLADRIGITSDDYNKSVYGDVNLKGFRGYGNKNKETTKGSKEENGNRIYSAAQVKASVNPENPKYDTYEKVKAYIEGKGYTVQ